MRRKVSWSCTLSTGISIQTGWNMICSNSGWVLINIYDKQGRQIYKSIGFGLVSTHATSISQWIRGHETFPPREMYNGRFRIVEAFFSKLV